MTAPQPREPIANLPAYLPGKPASGGPAAKLSSNENPYPPLPEILAAVSVAISELNRYPDMGCVQLYQSLAANLGVQPENLAATTGSVAAVYNLIQAFCEPNDEVVFPWRSFEAYPIAVQAHAAISVAVPNLSDGSHDLPALLAAVTDRTKILLLCTPNNPTGSALSHAELRQFLAKVPSRVLVVVDEAYREFVRMDDPVNGAALVAEFHNVAVLRTFAKAAGLASLRVGYLLSRPEIVAPIRAVSLPFGVSGPAQAAAIAALQNEPALLARVADIVAERDRVCAALTKQGWEIPAPQGNFVWLPLAERSLDFAAACAEVGLTVRPFAGEGVRVSIGLPASNDTFLQVAGNWLES